VWIIPAESPGEIGVIGIRHEVVELALVGETLEPVGEPTGNIELKRSIFGEFEGGPPSVGGGPGTDIDDDIPDSAPGASDEFDLGMRISLPVETAQDAAAKGSGGVGLGPMGIEAVIGEFRSAPGSSEPTTVIVPGFKTDEPQAIEWAGGEGHGSVWTICTEGRGRMKRPPASR